MDGAYEAEDYRAVDSADDKGDAGPGRDPAMRRACAQEERDQSAESHQHGERRRCVVIVTHAPGPFPPFCDVTL